MKFKKILSGLLAGAMALSMVNVSFADGEKNEYTWSFDVIQGWGVTAATVGKYTYTKDKDHTGNSGGSIKYEYKASGMKADSGTLVKTGISPWDGTATEKGSIYKVSAYVYGETVAEGAKVSISGVNVKKETVGTGDSVAIVAGQWTEVNGYFVSGVQDQLIFNFTGGAYSSDTNATTGYDIYYIDDIKVEKLTGAESDAALGKITPNYDFSKVLEKTPATLDLTKTNTLLAEGETSDLLAYSISGEIGKKWSEVVSTKLDATEFTAASSDSTVAVYNSTTGKIEAKSAGTAVLTFTNGTLTQPLTVTVYQEGNAVYNYFDGTNAYVTTSDPVCADQKAYALYGTSLLFGQVETKLDTRKPSVVSFNFFVPGTAGSSSDANSKINMIGTYGGGYTLQIQGVSSSGESQQVLFPNVKNIQNIVNTGWNKIEFITDYPKTQSKDNGYMELSWYLNGELKDSIEYMINAGTIRFRSIKNLMVSDFRVAQLDKSFKIKSLNPAANGVISALDDIDIEFNANIGTVSDGAVTLTDAAGNAVETKVLKADVAKLSVKPVGGLKTGSSYTVKIDNTKITDSTGAALAESAEYSFTTNSIDSVSDVTGRDYKLVNSQYDMIGSGRVTLNTANSEITADNTVKATFGKISAKTQLFTLDADASFTGDEKADRYIIEYDMQTEGTRETYTDAQGNEKTRPSEDNENVAIDFVNKSDTVSMISIAGSANNGVGNRLGLYFKTYADSSKYTDAEYKAKVCEVYSLNASKDMLWSDGLYKTSIVDTALENTGYYHVKLIYDAAATEGFGDFQATIEVTDNNGAKYSYGPIPVKAADFASIARITVSETANQYLISKTVSMKNVNMYALNKQSAAEEDFAVNGMTVTANNETINSNSELNGKNVTVSYTLKNNAKDDQQSYTVTTAVYEKGTNKLVAVDIASGTVNKGEETNTITNNIDLTGTTECTNYELKVFVWDGYKTLIPLITDVITPLN